MGRGMAADGRSGMGYEGHNFECDYLIVICLFLGSVERMAGGSILIRCSVSQSFAPCYREEKRAY